MTNNLLATANENNLKAAIKHLAEVDKVLAKLIYKYPVCDIRPNPDYYGSLVTSIISQQLSVKSADSILKKFKHLFNSSMPLPQEILQTDDELIRSAGLSYSKIRYIKDLASKIDSNELDLKKISILENQAITNELLNVKGIGVWTTHMFLIFSVGRLDVLPFGDLGIKKGVKLLYSLNQNPNESELIELSKKNRWNPYNSVASWYIWKSLDNK